MTGFAKLTIRVGLVVLATLAVARALLYLAYAWYRIPSTLEIFHLEAKMVYLAWRVQHGLVLYPDWQFYPHNSNFFGPLYFVAVGAIGRLTGADQGELYRIGRLATIASTLAAAWLVGRAAGRRYGPGAGVVAGLLAIGAKPLFGFGVMVRPDVAGDLLGFAGFLLATGRPSRGRMIVGVAMLVAAVFTKQTTAVYGLAAVLGLLLNGRWKAAGILAAGCAAATAAIVGVVTATVEPRFAVDLLGEADSPRAIGDWLFLLANFRRDAPELILLTIVGIVLWLARPRRDLPLAALAVVQLATSLVASMKLGADFNYFLGLRLVAALAAGGLWGLAVAAIRDPIRGRWARKLAIAATLTATSWTLWPSTRDTFFYAVQAREFLLDVEPRATIVLNRLTRVLDPPGLRYLTDSGPLALRQGERAPFVDPWLFRMLTVTGRIRPIVLRDRIAAGEFGLIVTTADLLQPGYDGYSFGLPPELAAAARGRYRPAGRVGNFFLYTPRDPSPPWP